MFLCHFHYATTNIANTFALLLSPAEPALLQPEHTPRGESQIVPELTM